MTLLEQIKKDQLEARKTASARSSILTVIIGECERIGKSLSDEEVLKVISKMLKSTKEALAFTNPVTAEQVKFEITILESYLPQQLTETQIRLVIAELKQAGIYDIKGIMAYFKANYAGQYDSKLVSNIALEGLK